MSAGQDYREFQPIPEEHAMANLGNEPIRNASDIKRFEAEMSLNERLPERSILDVFIASADQHPASTAITMLMTGAADEQPRQVGYAQLLELIRSAANMFSDLAGPTPGVAYILQSLVETHVTLWGAETVGFAVPINFLLQPDSIAELLKASGAKNPGRSWSAPPAGYLGKRFAFTGPDSRSDPRACFASRITCGRGRG